MPIKWSILLLSLFLSALFFLLPTPNARAYFVDQFQDDRSNTLPAFYPFGDPVSHVQSFTPHTYEFAGIKFWGQASWTTAFIQGVLCRGKLTATTTFDTNNGGASCSPDHVEVDYYDSSEITASTTSSEFTILSNATTTPDAAYYVLLNIYNPGGGGGQTLNLDYLNDDSTYLGGKGYKLDAGNTENLQEIGGDYYFYTLSNTPIYENHVEITNPSNNATTTAGWGVVAGYCPTNGTNRLHVFATTTVAWTYSDNTADYNVPCENYGFMAWVEFYEGKNYVVAADIERITYPTAPDLKDDIIVNPLGYGGTSNPLTQFCGENLDDNIVFQAGKKLLCWAIIGEVEQNINYLSDTIENTLTNKIPFAYWTKFKEAYDEQATSTTHNLKIYFSTSTWVGLWNTATPTGAFVSMTLFDFDNPDWPDKTLEALEFVETYILPALLTLWLFFTAITLFKKL